jgi:hypothetical protein
VAGLPDLGLLVMTPVLNPDPDCQITHGETMVKVTYNKQLTALLVIDPYNDFISEGGKIYIAALKALHG